MLKYYRTSISEGVSWQNDGLILPYYGESNTSADAFFFRNFGPGRAGFFQNFDSTSSGPALEGNTRGLGAGLIGRSPGMHPEDVGVAGYGRTGVSGVGNVVGSGVTGFGGTGVYGSGRGRNNAVGVLAWAEGDASISVLGEGTNYGVWGAGQNIGIYAHNMGGTSAGRDVLSGNEESRCRYVWRCLRAWECNQERRLVQD